MKNSIRSTLLNCTLTTALLALTVSSHSAKAYDEGQTADQAQSQVTPPASSTATESPVTIIDSPRPVQRTLSFQFKDCWNRIKFLGKDLSTFKRTRGIDGFFRFVVPSGYVFRCDLPQFPKSVSETLKTIKVNTPGVFAVGNKIAFKSDWLNSADDFLFMKNDWNDLPSSVNVVIFVGLSGASATVEVRDHRYEDYFLNLEDQPYSNLPRVVDTEKHAWMMAREALEQVLNPSLSVYVEGLEN